MVGHKQIHKVVGCRKNIIFIYDFEHLLNSFVKSVDERGVCEKNRI